MVKLEELNCEDVYRYQYEVTHTNTYHIFDFLCMLDPNSLSTIEHLKRKYDDRYIPLIRFNIISKGPLTRWHLDYFSIDGSGDLKYITKL